MSGGRSHAHWYSWSTECVIARKELDVAERDVFYYPYGRFQSSET